MRVLDLKRAIACLGELVEVARRGLKLLGGGREGVEHRRKLLQSQLVEQPCEFVLPLKAVPDDIRLEPGVIDRDKAHIGVRLLLRHLLVQVLIPLDVILEGRQRPAALGVPPDEGVFVKIPAVDTLY